MQEIPLVLFAKGNSYILLYFQVFNEDLKPLLKTRIPWRCARRFNAIDETKLATYLCLLLLSNIYPSKLDYVYKTFLILKAVKSYATERYTRMGLARI